MPEVSEHDSPITIPLDGSLRSIGRDPRCNIVIGGAGVSRIHARFHLTPDGPFIVDNGSSFGIRVDDNPVAQALLRPNSEITIGVMRYRVAFEENRMILTPVRGQGTTRFSDNTVPLSGTISIGRDSTNTIQCNHPLVSRFHARLRSTGDGAFVAEDIQSTNGTFVNGRQYRQTVLRDGDVLQIGPYRFFVEDGHVIQADDYNRIKLEAFGVSVYRGNHTALRDISIAIQPGEFVVILGPSGAGKTTLAHALTGRIPLCGGHVYVNTMPLRRFYSAFRSSIGFVSQHNLLHQELTVYETFYEQSRLRLPADCLPAERDTRIGEVMRFLDITAVARQRVSALSGGEAKRVHLGIELLSSPALIFLDEPLAGLDPGLTGTFMKLFRKICDDGHTILLATHTLEQLDLCDKVLFLSNGELLFSGAPSELTGAFGVDAVSRVYDSVRAGNKGDARLDRKKLLPGAVHGVDGHENPPLPETLPPFRISKKTSGASWMAQLGILTGRYWKIMIRDYRNMGVVLLQVPFICALLALVFEHDSSFFPLSFYFCITISCIWIGGINTVREIAREWPIIDREYRAGLSLVALACSKIIVFGSLSVVQGLLFGFFLRLFFTRFDFTAQIGFILAAASLCGAFIGLSVSALSPKVNRAISLLPIALIPQIFFSGILVPFDRMTAAGRAVSHLTVSRPVFSLFKKACILEHSIGRAGEWRVLLVLLIVLIILVLVGLKLNVSRSGREIHD